MKIDSVAELKRSAIQDSEPPADLAPPVLALWFAKAGRWEEAHNIAQDIDTKMGSWIHAHLHVIEGDLGNAGYWYRRAGQTERAAEELEREWEEIAEAALAAQ